MRRSSRTSTTSEGLSCTGEAATGLGAREFLGGGKQARHLGWCHMGHGGVEIVALLHFDKDHVMSIGKDKVDLATATAPAFRNLPISTIPVQRGNDGFGGQSRMIRHATTFNAAGNRKLSFVKGHGSFLSVVIAGQIKRALINAPTRCVQGIGHHRRGILHRHLA